MSYNNNPYNFVPLYGRVFKRYDDPSQLPSHGAINDNLYSGTINCTITAETPISISDGNDGFIKNAAGKYVIPGSTLKGIIRTNMMILGFGAMRPGEDYNATTLMYRVVAARNTDPRKPLQKYYNNILGVKSVREPNPNGGKPISYSVAEKVRSGYLRKDSDGKYRIYPAEYYKINRAANIASQWRFSYTSEETVWYKINGDRVVELKQKEAEGLEKGILLCTGRAVQTPNHLYLFREFDEKAEPVELSDEEILIYKSDYEMRKNSLGGTDSGRKMDPKYWEIPDDGTPWPIFYNLIDSTGMTFFGRSPFFRAGYKHSLKEGVTVSHRQATEKLTLDYVYSMLGFTWKDKTDKSKDYSYRSRVSFGDFKTDNGETKTESMVLAGPKPSSFADYSEKGRDYNQDEFKIRGIKQYWLKEPRSMDPRAIKEKQRTDLTTLPIGTKFTGKIRFTNLAADELGLLLWCLRLNDGCFQTIGKGKPFGYGRCSVEINGVYKDVPEMLYSSVWSENGITQPLNTDDMIAAYKEHIGEWLKKPVDEMRPIKDFMTIHSAIREWDDVRYMTFDEYRRRLGVLPDITEFRETLSAADDEPVGEPQSLEDMFARYKNRNGGITIKL